MNIVPFPRSVWQPAPMTRFPIWFLCRHRDCPVMFGARTEAEAKAELEHHLITEHDEPRGAA